MERYFIKHGKKHHEKTRDLAQSLWNKRGKPVFPPSIGMAFSLVLSFAVLVFSLSALAAGVMLIIQYDFFFIAVLISFFLIAVALFPLIAFIPRRKKEHEYFDIDLSQYPASREFLDLLCEKMSIPKIEKLTLSRDYNARIVGGFFNLSQNEVRRPCTGSSSGYALLKRLQFCAHLLDLAPTHFLGSSAYSRAEMTA
jgi:large-conductance mechanosensitive channel